MDVNWSAHIFHVTFETPTRLKRTSRKAAKTQNHEDFFASFDKMCHGNIFPSASESEGIRRMTDSVPPPESVPDEPWLEVTSSREFPAWLADQNLSLAFTTYQTGKLFLLGRNTLG